MRVNNSKGETYIFNESEITLLFMWAFGYVDLAEKGHLPIDLDEDMEIINLKKKLKQCIANQIEINEKTRKFY